MGSAWRRDAHAFASFWSWQLEQIVCTKNKYSQSPIKLDQGNHIGIMVLWCLLPNTSQRLQAETPFSRLSKAQTVAFISLVWCGSSASDRVTSEGWVGFSCSRSRMRSENIRAYISRSFTNPMWHDILGNKHMQKAIVMAQVCLYVVAWHAVGHWNLPKDHAKGYKRFAVISSIHLAFLSRPSQHFNHQEFWNFELPQWDSAYFTFVS